MYVAFELGLEEGEDFLSAKEASWNKGCGSLICPQVAEQVRAPGAWNVGWIVWKAGWS